MAPSPQRPSNTQPPHALHRPIEAADPHKVLQVSPAADVDELRRAYKLRLLETHPDKARGSRAAFEAVHAAYKALTAEKRLTPSVVADIVSLDDMDMEEDADNSGDLWARMECRCGDWFSVRVDDVRPPFVDVICSGCSLSLRVES